MGMVLAQLNAIPSDPTAMWILAAAMVIGGGISTMCVIRAFGSVKEAASGTRSAVTEMLNFCRDESTRREVVISRICDAHESVGNNIATRIEAMHDTLVRHSTETSSKLDQIHGEVKRPPRKTGNS